MRLFLRVSYDESVFESFYEVTRFPCRLGRGPGNDIVLMGDDIQRQHAELVCEENQILFRDLSNSARPQPDASVPVEQPLVEGLTLRLGRAQLIFSFVDFPMQSSTARSHETFEPQHEPILKRFERSLDGKSTLVLFAICLVTAFCSSPNHWRQNDAYKNLIQSLLQTSLLNPILLTLFIVVVRKINQGSYSWNRSLSLAFIFIILGQWALLFERSLCWFQTFEVVWNSTLVSILVSTLVVLWWFCAVGRESSLRSRLLRSFGLACLISGMLYCVQLLSTGYKSGYEIETCDSLTGWHWGAGEPLTSLEDFLTKAAQKLEEK